MAALLLVGERGVPYLVAVPGGASSPPRGSVPRPRSSWCAGSIGRPGSRPRSPRSAWRRLLVAIEIFLPRWVAGLEGLARVPSTPPVGLALVDVGVVTFTGDHPRRRRVVTRGDHPGRHARPPPRRRRGRRAGGRAQADPGGAGSASRSVGSGPAIWAVAAVASAAAVLLRVPLVGFELRGLIGPGVLLYGLATATIARFEHPGRALAAGMAVGSRRAGQRCSPPAAPVAADIAMFVLVVVALVLQRAGRGRLAAAGTWLPAREGAVAAARGVVRPPRSRAVRTVVSARLGPAGRGPALLLSAGQPTKFTTLCAAAVVAVSGVILTGWSGQWASAGWRSPGSAPPVGGALVTSSGRGGRHARGPRGRGGDAGRWSACSSGCRWCASPESAQLAITTLVFAFGVPAFISDPGPLDWLLPDGPVLRPGFVRPGGPQPRAPASPYVALALLVLALVVAHRFRRSAPGAWPSRAGTTCARSPAWAPALVRVQAFTFAVSGAPSPGRPAP